MDYESLRPTWLPQCDGQRKAARIFPACRVLFLLGGPGSGKTHTAVALALQALAAKRHAKILLTRPTVECGETLGFLSGDLAEKYGPWLGPFRDVLGGMGQRLDRLPVELCPLQYLRGRTVDDVLILDEGQNCLRGQLRMALTRLGKRGQIIVAGDPGQRDTARDSLLWGSRRVDGLDGVRVVRLLGQYRADLVSQMDRRLS